MDILIISSSHEGNQSLTKIRNKTLIEHQIRVLRQKFKKSPIIVVAGENAPQVFQNAPAIKIENPLYDTMADTMSVYLASHNFKSDSLLIVDGNVYFEEPWKFHYSKQSYTLLSNNPRDVGFTTTNDKTKRYVGNMFYNLGDPWSGVTHLMGKELELFLGIIEENKNLFLFEALNEVVRLGGKILVVPTDISLVDLSYEGKNE